MNTLVLLVLALAVAFAVVVALRSYSEVDELQREIKKIQAKLSGAEADLSILQRRLETVRMDLAESDRPRLETPREEPTRADPRVYVQRVPDQPHDRVILSNRSAAIARDLTLDITCPGGVTPFLPEFADKNFPVDMLEQGVPYIVLASFRGQCWPPVDARLSWRDVDGLAQVREFKLYW